MDKINFDLVGNNQDLIKKMNEAQAAFVNLGRTAEEQGRRMNAAFDSVSLESVKQLREALLGMPVELRGLDSIRKQLSDLDRQLGQIEKELSKMGPSAKSSFTGISDNMPVVVNSLQVAHEQFKELNAAGKGSGPVWKQALSSLGSWQTAVTAGITLLAIYGDKVVEWFRNLGKSSDYIDKARIEQDVLNKSVQEYNNHLADAYSESGRQASIISQLSTEWRKLGNDFSGKKKFIDANKEAFRELGIEVNSVKDAENLLVNNTGNFIAAIKFRAKSIAGQSTLQKLYAEQQMLEEKIQMGKKVAEARAKIPTADDVNEADRRNRTLATMTPEERGYRDNKVTAGDIAEERAQQMLKGVKLNEVRLNVIEKQISRTAQSVWKDTQEYKKLMDNSGFKPSKTDQPSVNVEDEALKRRQQQAKLDELLDKQDQENRRRAQERENLDCQAEIDTLDEGAEKKLKQLNLNHEKELQQLEQEKKDTLNLKIRNAREIFNAEQDKKDPSKRDVFDPSTVRLSVSELKSYSEREVNILKRQQKELDAYNAAQKAAMGEFLVLYAAYMEKRQAILDRGEAEKRGKSQEEQDVIDQQTQKTLNALEVGVQKETNAFAKLFSDLRKRSVEDIGAITKQAEETLAFVKGGKWDKEQGAKLGISEEDFNYLQTVPEKVEKIEKSFTGATNETKKLDSAFQKMKDGFNSVFSAGADTKKLKDGLAEIEGAMNEVMAAGKLLSNSFSSLGNAFGNDALKGIAEGMNAAMDAASATMNGAKAGAVFGPWGAAAGAAIGLATSLTSSIAKIHDAKNEKRIKKLQEQIDTLNRSYKDLGDSVEKAYSSDASQLIEQQNTLLEQQKVLIQNQIKEEQDKKNTDDAKIREYQNRIEDIDKTIAKNKEKQIDVIFGQDVKSAIDNFAQAYADAWTTGNDRAKSSKDFVKNMIKQMILESIKAASSQPMEALRQRLAGFFSDGIISAWEQEEIERDAARLMDSLDSKFAWADRFMEDEEKTTREASQKGMAQASQESVDKLDGVMTNMQGHTYSINENVRAILDTIRGDSATGMPGTGKTAEFGSNTVSLADIDRNMSSMIGLGNMAVSHLSSIADNTSRLATIEQTMSSIKLGIDTMNTKGITIKR